MKKITAYMLSLFTVISMLSSSVSADGDSRKFYVGNAEYILTDSIKTIDDKRYFGVLNSAEVTVSGHGQKARMMLENWENEAVDGIKSIDLKLYYEYAQWGDTWWFYKSPYEYKEQKFPAEYFDGYLTATDWQMNSASVCDGNTYVVGDAEVCLPSYEELLEIMEHDTVSTTATNRMYMTRSVMSVGEKFYVRRYKAGDAASGNIEVRYLKGSEQAQGWNTRDGYGVSEGGGWLMMSYVSEDFFRETKLDISKISSGAKEIITTYFTKDDLKDIYTKDELRSIGFKDDITTESSFEELVFPVEPGELTGYVSVTNNTDIETVTPSVIVVSYDENGNVVGGTACVGGVLLPGKTTADAAEVLLSLSGTSNGISVFAVASGENPYPVAADVCYGDEYDFSSDSSSEDDMTVSFDVSRMKVDVSGTLPENADEELFLVLFKQNKGIADIQSSGSLNDVIINAVQFKTDIDGKYSCSLPVNNLEYKNYDILLAKKGGAVSGSFFYKDSDYETIALSDFAKLKAGEITLDDMVESYSEAWGESFETEIYESLQGEFKAAVCKALDDTYITSAEAVSDLNRQMAIQLLSSAEDAQSVVSCIEKYNSIIGLDVENYIDKLENTEQKNSVYTQLADGEFADFKELEAAYEKSVLIAKINAVTSYKDIKTILQEADVSEYGIDMTMFTKLSKTDFAKSLAVNYSSWDEFEENFREKAEYYEKKKPQSSGGGGGGGGGTAKKKSNIMGVSTPVIEKEQKTEESAKPSEKKYFDDLGEAEWAKEYINTLAERGIVNGVDGNSFKPLNLITREEFIKMLTLATGISPIDGDSVFSDVDSGSWYAGYVNAAYEKGITSGKEDGTFGVGEYITREDAAVLIFRATGRSSAENYREFADDEEISAYAKEAVYSLASSEVINGMDGNFFAPKKFASRAEVAKIICLGVIKK